MLLASLFVGPPLRAQPSPSCQFATTVYVGTLIELDSARKSHRACAKEGRSSCKPEFARVRELQLRLKLARDYLDRYCMK